AERPSQAGIYPDGGVSRPGDPAHVVAVVRDAKARAPAKPLPVDVQVFDPRAKVVRKIALKTNPAGIVALDQAFPAFADTGHWRGSVAGGGKPPPAPGLPAAGGGPPRRRGGRTPEKPEQGTRGKAGVGMSGEGP